MISEISEEDRRILVLAAKASGVLHPSWYDSESYIDGMLERWNPRDSNADSFDLIARLAIKVEYEWCGMNDQYDVVRATKGNISEWEQIGFQGNYYYPEDRGTRLAVLAVAAKIGERM